MSRAGGWAASALVLGAAWWWASPTVVQEPAIGHAESAAQEEPAQHSATALASAAGWISGTTRRSAAQWDSWLFTQSSLRGGSLDGDWGEIGPQGLVPSLDLRRRFDQLMTTLGELNTTELRAMVQSLAERDLGRDAAGQVMAVWDRYVALVHAPLTSRPDLDDPRQWLVVLREQQAQRSQMLGPDWASAFFADDEAQLRSTVERLSAPPSSDQVPPVAIWAPAPSGVGTESWQEQRRHTLGAEAAVRLAALDAEENEWANRLDAARQTRLALTARAELSDLQQQQAWRHWLANQFSAQELPRVQALLGD